jgi:hypothetical protein
MRKPLVFILSVTMPGLGLYWAGGELLSSHLHGRPLKLMLLAGVFPAFLGGYLLWVDFIAPAFGIKTGEEPQAPWAETYAQRLYNVLPAPNDLGDITALRLRIPTALHQAYQNKIILQREMICFVALMSVATPESKLFPVMGAFGNLLVSKLDARGLQVTRDQLAEHALKDVETMLTEPFPWGQRWLAEFRSDPKDNYMVAVFADHCCRLFQAYKHSIESTQPK